MKIRFLFILFQAAALAAVEPPEPLARAQANYEKKKKPIDEAHAAALRQLNQAYFTRLARLRDARKEQGALNDLLAIGMEQKRFTENTTVRKADLVDKPVELGRLQRSYLQQQAKEAHARDQKLVQLNQQHFAVLAQLIKALTQADRLEEGLLVQDARKVFADTALLKLDTPAPPARKPNRVTPALKLPKEGLLAHYDFETGARDRSPKQHDGKLKGARCAPGGKQGKGLHLDGSGDWFEVNSAAIAGARTIAFWMKPGEHYDEKESDFIAVLFRDSRSERHEFGFAMYPKSHPAAGRLGFARRVQTAFHDVLSDESNWRKDAWYHVAGVIDPQRGMRLYINAVEQRETDHTTNPVPGAEDTTVVGRHGMLDRRYFKGVIDELRCYDRALSAEQVGRLARP